VTIQRLIVLGVVVGLALAAIFVWPTAYRYDHLKIGDNTFPVRIDRFTGRTEVLNTHGWITPGQTQVHEKPLHDLTPQEIQQLSVTATIPYTILKAQVYNGTKYRISEITLVISVFDSKGREVLSNREYRAAAYPGPGPKTSDEFLVSLGFELEQGQTWQFNLTGAKGKEE
jgi:hypothetical protein